MRLGLPVGSSCGRRRCSHDPLRSTGSNRRTTDTCSGDPSTWASDLDLLTGLRVGVRDVRAWQSADEERIVVLFVLYPTGKRD